MKAHCLGLAFLIATSAHAFVIGEGAERVARNEYHAVCKITVKTPNGNGEVSCSGTLISENEILTAGHCFTRDYQLDPNSLEVTCQGHYESDVASVALPDQSKNEFWYYNPLSGKEIPIASQDKAILTLKKNSKTMPFQIAKPSAYYDTSETLKPNVKCRVLGYGYNSLTDDSMSPNLGILVAAAYKSVKIKYDGELVYVTPKNGTYLSVSEGHGDSGGPLLCSLSEDSDEEVLGVANSVVSTSDDQVTANVFVPAWK